MAYFVVDSPVVNASCGVGGVVTTYGGLLRVLQAEENKARRLAIRRNLAKQAAVQRLAAQEARQSVFGFVWRMIGAMPVSSSPTVGAGTGSRERVQAPPESRAATLLAGILAHELGHDIAGHVTENVAWMPFWLLVQVFGFLLNPALVRDMLSLGMMLPLSR